MRQRCPGAPHILQEVNLGDSQRTMECQGSICSDRSSTVRSRGCLQQRHQEAMNSNLWMCLCFGLFSSWVHVCHLGPLQRGKIFLPSPHKSTHRSLSTKKLLRRRACFVSQREVLAEQEDASLTWKGQHREIGGRFLSQVLQSCTQSQTKGHSSINLEMENLCSGCDREDPCSPEVPLPFSHTKIEG